MMELDTDIPQARSGKVTGVIIPPPDIKAICDKTAQFVARNGKSFEERILNSADGKTPKFNFMRPLDPFHAYYEYKIREFEEGGGAPAPTAPQVQQPAAKQPEPEQQKSVAASAQASLTTPIAQFSLNKPKDPPHPLEFSLIRHPLGLKAVDFDIIKLTAQYTAYNGREFLQRVAIEQQQNALFDFLKPTHILFNYFTTLVEFYVKILSPSSDTLSRTEQKCIRLKVLESAVHRYEYDKEQQEKKKMEARNNNGLDLSNKNDSVDWKDFFVVETIEFGEDELLELPGMGVLDLGDNRASGGNNSATDEMDVDGDAHCKKDLTTGQKRLQQMKSSLRDSIEGEDGIKVVRDYVPRMSSTVSAAGTSTMTMVDPVSGREVPVDQMSEHMRVQLIDPRWRIEQQRFQDKQKESGYAEGESIADSLKQFARKRGDIFGSAEVTGPPSDKRSKAERDGEEQMDTSNGAMHSVPVLALPSMTAFVAPPMLSTPVGQMAMPPPMMAVALPLSAPMPLPVHVSAPPVPLAVHLPPPVGTYTLPPRPAFPPGAPLPVPPAQMFAPPAMPHMIAPPVMMQLPPRPLSAPKIIELVSAEEFASRYDGPINVNVNLPSDKSNEAWNLNGQTISISIDVRKSVKELREAITAMLSDSKMPTSKFQLKDLKSNAFLKDVASLAEMNIGHDYGHLELSLKSRGGKK